MKSLCLSVIAGILLQGCTPEIAQNYPTHNTAVVRTYVHNFGFKGLFASESTQTVYTRADKRRAEDQFRFSGFVMKHLAKSNDIATIWRIDKNLQWRLDLENRTYTECPLLGCVSPRHPRASRQEQPAQQEPPKREPSCKLAIAKNRFSVDSTGQTRSINGFNTKEYKVSWDIVLQDRHKKKDVSTLTIDIWTTPESDPRLAAVREVDGKFERALNAKRPEKSGLGKVVPSEAMKVLAMQFLNGLTADQRAAITSAARELSKIHGHPISTRLDWYLDGEACQSDSKPVEKQEKKPGFDVFHGVGGFVGSATNVAVQKGAENKAKEMAGKPVFGFVEEVQEAQVEQASDGFFVPPPSFKLVDRH